MAGGGVNTAQVRAVYLESDKRPAGWDIFGAVKTLCDEVDRLRAKVAEQRTLISEIAVERERLRAALEEEFDFDRLPIPRFVNWSVTASTVLVANG